MAHPTRHAQVFTTENWNVVMYDAWRAVGWASSLYFVILILLGQYVVLDLFEVGRTAASAALPIIWLTSPPKPPVYLLLPSLLYVHVFALLL